MGVVEKNNSGKFRTIMNLSHPKGIAVNEFISKDDYSLTYVTVDSAIERILDLGKGCLLTKIEVEKAFRAVPVHPFHGIYWVFHGRIAFISTQCCPWVVVLLRLFLMLLLMLQSLSANTIIR